MDCEQIREALSAQLDGEDDHAERVTVDAHLADCVSCRRWFDAAASITRLARTSLVAPSDFAVGAEVLDAAPGPGRRRLVFALRTALGLLGTAQFLLGAAQIGDFAAAQQLHMLGAFPATGTNHLWHESAAWNVAIGAGFAWIALRRTRPVGIVPTLTAFVAVLSLLTVNDLVAGRVDLARVLSHAFIVLGYLVILALSHRALDPAEPPPGGETARWRAHFDDDSDDDETSLTPAALRLIPGLPPPAQARSVQTWSAGELSGQTRSGVRNDGGRRAA